MRQKHSFCLAVRRRRGFGRIPRYPRMQKLPDDTKLRMTCYSNPKYAFLTFGSDSNAEALSEKAMRPVSIT